ncbi:MAG: hypothetical protein EWV70_13465 [Microcystis flos-aquae Mf_QC_C_20070823_S20]|nr:MAG: hypothetical protein EWV70_13465 [Microcystis flos-aquae Mf_QC_C_20070823_S20]
MGTPLIKGGLKGGLRGDRHPPYQGGQGGSNLKSIFNLIITSYNLYLTIVRQEARPEQFVFTSRR